MAKTTSSSACIGCSFLRVLTMLIMYNNSDKLIQTYLLTIHILFSFGHRWRVKWATRVSSPGISNGISCCPSNTAAAIGCGCTRTARRKKPCGTLICTWRVAEGKQNRNWLAHHGPPWLTCSINAFPFEEAHRKLWPLATAGWMDVVGWFDLPFISHLQ